ncbi:MULTISPECIES: hypothetical protein [unclassified Mesorhizobium]|nr:MULTISPECIES: hypothetical protein [unclassified Mesorhizobium]
MPGALEGTTVVSLKTAVGPVELFAPPVTVDGKRPELGQGALAW